MELNMNLGQKWENLLKGDEVALALVKEAADSFQKSKEDRELLKKLNQESRILAEEFLNAYLSANLDESSIEQVQKELSNIRVERTLKGASAELLEMYRMLGLIREYSSRSVELDYPQCTADPLMLRGYPTEIIETVGRKKGVEIQLLVDLIKKAHRSMGLPDDYIPPTVASQYKSLSVPLLLKYMDIKATKVYFMGPVFYGNAGNEWTLTFSTGSGLPDPLEWNGAIWYIHRYSVNDLELEKHGLKADKNPFRALNFSVGIINQHWDCKRLYVWQYSKTSKQIKGAYATAKDNGKGRLYLKDATKQLTNVFKTNNLMILELEEFPNALTAWTRVSPSDIMLSCRPGTAESKIAHGIWLRPGLRISQGSVNALKNISSGLISGSTGLIAGMVGGPGLGMALAVLAQVGVSHLIGQQIKDEEERHRREIIELQENATAVFNSLWSADDLPGLIKLPHSYVETKALNAAKSTLSHLLDISEDEIIDAYKDNST